MDLEPTGAGEDLSVYARTDTTPEAEPEAAAQPVQEAEPPAAEDKLTRLERIVATDPTLRRAYTMDVLGMNPAMAYQQQQPPPQYMPEPQNVPQQQAQPTANELPFGEGEYDPYNPQHAYALQQRAIAEQMAPMQQLFAQAQQQQQIAYMQEQQEQEERLLETNRTAMDKHIPGFSEWCAPTANPEGRAIATFAHQLFQERQSQYDPAFWGTPQLSQQIVNDIAPQIKGLASRMGLSSSVPPQTVNRDKARETYVESSNAVPRDSSNKFSVAYEKNDMLGMIQALKK